MQRRRLVVAAEIHVLRLVRGIVLGQVVFEQIVLEQIVRLEERFLLLVGLLEEIAVVDLFELLGLASLAPRTAPGLLRLDQGSELLRPLPAEDRERVLGAEALAARSTSRRYVPFSISRATRLQYC
jgi:hypothetical protein